MTVTDCLVLSVCTSYCSALGLGAILEVLWTERGVGCADNRPGCSLLLRQVCDLFNVPEDSSSGARDQRLRFEPLGATCLLQSCTVWRRHGGEECRKSTIFIYDQSTYIVLFVGRSSCMKICPQSCQRRLKPMHPKVPSLKLPTAEIRCTAT